MDQILKIKLGREVKDYLSITFGLICYALGWAAFLLPYQITTGGVTGISAIIYYVTGIEIQVSYFIINAVFLGFALKILGPKFSLKTIYAIFMLTFLLWLFQALLKNPTREHHFSRRWHFACSPPYHSHPYRATMTWTSSNPIPSRWKRCLCPTRLRRVRRWKSAVS